MKETGETINLMAKGQSAILMGHTMLENSWTVSKTTIVQYLDGTMEKFMKGLLEMDIWKDKANYDSKTAERDVIKDFFHAI